MSSLVFFFFFSSRRRHTRFDCDWSSDVCSSDLPVHIEHRGGHTTYANSLAFRKAGIDEKTPDPPGGKIDRDPATGKPTGRVAESANDFFDKAIPRHFTRDDHRSEEHTSELQSQSNLVCRLLLEK